MRLGTPSRNEGVVNEAYLHSISVITRSLLPSSGISRRDIIHHGHVRGVIARHFRDWAFMKAAVRWNPSCLPGWHDRGKRARRRYLREDKFGGGKTGGKTFNARRRWSSWCVSAVGTKWVAWELDLYWTQGKVYRERRIQFFHLCRRFGRNGVWACLIKFSINLFKNETFWGKVFYTLDLFLQVWMFIEIWES